MNEKPTRNNENRRGTPQGRGGTGEFRLKIDESQLTNSNIDIGERRRSTGVPYAEPPQNRKAYYTEEERKAERKAHKKRNKLKARKNKRVFSIVWICMVVLVSLTLASYLIGGSDDFFAVGRPEGTTQVDVPANVTAEELADILYEAGAINKKEFFTIYCNVTADMDYFEEGTYEISTNADYEDLINTLQGGNQVLEEVRVTFPEGVTVLEMAQLLEENEVCTAQEFLDALNTMDFTNYDHVALMGDATGKYYKLEGYLFPDTYDFWKGEELTSVIGKLLYNFENKLTDEVQRLVEQSDLTMDQIITLASIIQREAANTSDMYEVSAVLHNRLSFGANYGIYRLQCDSTTFYPYKVQADIPETNALSYGNYDTYQIEGLPAGAICNPGADAILAAVKPSTEGDAPSYLYFCHAADGTAYYATNESDHAYNLQLAGLA